MNSSLDFIDYVDLNMYLYIKNIYLHIFTIFIYLYCILKNKNV
jgi:hypothetical protein